MWEEGLPKMLVTICQTTQSHILNDSTPYSQCHEKLKFQSTYVSKYEITAFNENEEYVDVYQEWRNSNEQVNEMIMLAE
jgi:hypothetical protein